MLRNYVLICWSFSMGMVYYGDGTEKLSHKETVIAIVSAPVLFPVSFTKLVLNVEDEIK